MKTLIGFEEIEDKIITLRGQKYFWTGMLLLCTGWKHGILISPSEIIRINSPKGMLLN